MDSGDSLNMAGGLPVSASAERIQQKLDDLSPAKETGRKNLGKILMVLSFVSLFGGFGLGFIFINLKMMGMVLPVMGSGFLLYFILLFYGGYLYKLGVVAEIQQPIADIVSPMLAPEEKVLALCTTVRTGATLWLTGISKQGCLVFTSQRLLLVVMKSSFKSLIKALENPRDNISLYVCDLGDPGKVKIGGMMFPPIMNLVGKKISIQPEGQDKAITWCAHTRFGKNGATIRQILDRVAQ